MKKTFIAAALAVAAVSSFAAQADESSQLNNFFIAGNLGQSNLRADFTHKNSVFQGINAGWRWNGIVGAEVGYAYLGRPKIQSTYESSSLKTQAATVGVNARYDFVPNWYVSGRAGYARTRALAEGTAGDFSAKSRSWNNGWYGGVGVGYNITTHASLGLNYDNYRVEVGRKGEDRSTANIAAYSVGFEYRL
jgi:OmpA-OmpF porin, OOP family